MGKLEDPSKTQAIPVNEGVKTTKFSLKELAEFQRSAGQGSPQPLPPEPQKRKGSRKAKASAPR